MDKQTYIELFSKTRIDSYTSIDEHEKNFQILDKIASKLARIEIILRNRIDRAMNNLDKNWLFHLPSTICLNDNEGKIKEHNTLISKQTFGFWVKMVEYYEIYDCLFEKDFLESFFFKKYSQFNKEKVAKQHLYSWQKAYIILTLLKNMRNRAFHFENLFKLNHGKPRLNTFVDFKNGYVIAGVEPSKINELLDDVLVGFNAGFKNKSGEESPL